MSSASATTSTLPAEHICKYSSKPCQNSRAIKKTGDLHSFCEFHRSMANRNQRRCEQKRRNKRKNDQTHSHPFTIARSNNALLAQIGAKRQRMSPTSVDSAVVVAMPSLDLETKDELVACGLKGLDSLEPFDHPVSLQMEDLEYLFMTVVDYALL